MIPEAWKAVPSSRPPDPFPFMAYYEPYPTGQPIFDRDVTQPSFLHPNGQWVVLPCASGGYEVWDWRAGLPVQKIGGPHEGDLPSGPCGNQDRLAGCYASDGRTWISARVWSGGDDGQALTGTRADGSGSWDQGLPLTAQVDPRRPVIHVVGNMVVGDCTGILELDALTGKPKALGDLPPPIQINYSSLAQVSTDGRWLLVRHEAAPQGQTQNGWGWWAVWSLPDGRCRAYQWDRMAAGVAPAFSLDGATAFLPGGREWQWSGQETRSELASTPWSVGGLGPDQVEMDRGKICLIRKGQGLLEVRDATNQALIRRLAAFPPNNALIAFGPKPHLLLASEPSGTPWVWNREAPSRATPSTMSDGPLQRPGFSALDLGSARSLAWSKDGSRMGVGLDGGQIGVFNASGFRMPDGTKKDDASLGKPSRTLTGLNASVRGLAFLADDLVAGLAEDGTVAIWGPDGGSPIRTWMAHPSRSNSLLAMPDGRHLATGSLDGVALWSIDDGACLRRYGAPHSGATSLHFDPHGQRIAATYLDGWLALFDVRTGTAIWEVQAHPEVAAAVAFHPSGSWVLSLGWDGSLRRWNAKTGSLESQYPAPTTAGCLAWSSDGKWLAIGGSAPEVWDASLTKKVAYLNFRWDEECT